jgi:hypothetical protein
MEQGACAIHKLWGTLVRRWCDDRIEDDPVSYTDPVEVEGVGIVHGYCAEGALEHSAG